MLKLLLSLIATSTLLTSVNVTPLDPDWSLLTASNDQPTSGPLLEPIVKAKAAIVIDADSGRILWGKNDDQPLPIASLTKVMTALLILDDYQPDRIITIPDEANKIVGNWLALRPGHRWYMRDLLNLALVSSNNDAAYSLADHFSNGNLGSFITQMNTTATNLGLKQTHFGGVTGMDDEGNVSTAHDLAQIARTAYRHPTFAQVVNQGQITVTNLSTTEQLTLDNTNFLLKSYLPIFGLKTGTTDAAGPCLISLARQNGHQLISVVLNSPDRFQESKALLDWALHSY